MTGGLRYDHWLMPAQTPREIHRLFLDAFNAGSIDGLLALYEDNAAFVNGDRSVMNGLAALRPVLEGFLGMKGRMEMETVSVLEGGRDLALLSGRWMLSATGPDGGPIRMTGTSQEVARRGTDGAWRYVIDDPGVGR